VLVNLNRLFYENAERGVFVSMIYGVIDVNTQTFTFARAGHNPMILKSSVKGLVEEISPSGIALGLEPGEIFTRTIEEKTIVIKQNDVIFFYTDGLNEAQNRFHEEFGEERLTRVIETYSDLAAEDMLNEVQQEIRRFTANATQHDDMTAVVVKII
jgi:sigma-B regulation protein RsbU (phosphoserine phosphatase)